MAMMVMLLKCTRDRCGWIGPAHEPPVKDAETGDRCCPQCFGRVVPWPVDQAREAKALDRERSARIEATQRSNETCRRSRLAYERLQEANAQITRCRARLTLAEVDGNVQCVFAANRALIAAEGEAASAFVAHKAAQ
jgi:hypothetical protein